MKKIIISLMLVLTLSLTFSGCSGRKVNPASDFEYTISNDGRVGIEKYIGESKDVVIPEKIHDKPVTAIGICAFAELGIESIVIPDTVVIIWNNAFYGCKNLHTVDMGDGVETLIQETFGNCPKLGNLKLSSKLKNTDAKAFSGCTSLKKLHIPRALEKWGSELFYGNTLTDLTFEDGIETVGCYACFWNTGTLKEVTFPASVKKLGEWTFNTGIENAYFEGDAPAEIGLKPFGESKVTIHYRKGTKGWEDTELREWYTLVEE